MKSILVAFLALAGLSAAMANTAPTPVVVSAAMRPGTTLMDVVFRVSDPDDATVKVRALAFVDGVRSFANVLRPVTFVEGTAAKIGDAIPANVDHTLTWDVAADWDIDLGQVKFEVLALDGRGLLAFDWITIPPAEGHPALTIGKDAPSDAAVLSASFWQYAEGDPWLSLENGVLTGNAGSGVFADLALVSGSAPQSFGTPYIFKRMNLDLANRMEMDYASSTARAGLLATSNWHAVNRPYAGVSKVAGWGGSNPSAIKIPAHLSGVAALAAGQGHSLAVESEGTVVGWGSNAYGQTTIPAGLTGVTALAAGNYHSLALKGDGTVVAWGRNNLGQTTIPAGLAGVIAIAASDDHSLAVKGDGSVVGWGDNQFGQITIPVGLTGVIGVAAGAYTCYALKGNGTVVGLGSATLPAGLTGVTAIASGRSHILALKDDGTVFAWGTNIFGETTIPVGLSGVTAIAAGTGFSLALKADGTVVAWGTNDSLQITIPAGLKGVTAIAAGKSHSLAAQAKAL